MKGFGTIAIRGWNSRCGGAIGRLNLKKIALPVVCVVLWYLLSQVFVVFSPIIAPPPSAVGEAVVDLVGTGELLLHVRSSLTRVFLGFAMAALFALVLGTFMGLYQGIMDIAQGMVNLLRPIPPLAWIPLAILWFGIGDASAVFIVAYAAFFPILLNTISGVKDVDRLMVRAAKTLGARDRFIVLHVILPAALPSVITGLRLGLGISWAAIVAAELIAAQSGLGYMIEYYRRLIMTEKVVLGMIVIGVIGLGLDIVLRRLEEIVRPWRAGLKI